MFLLLSTIAADNFHNTGWIPSLQPQINFPRYVHLLSPPHSPILNYQQHKPTGEPEKPRLPKCLIFLIVLITIYFSKPVISHVPVG